ncbi:MAG: hypothetical protein WCF01_07370 [Nitrososphaeraceae archaeon]
MFWIPNFSTISLSLNCLGEGCSANADGCFSSACKALQQKGNSRGHGSDPSSKNDESLVQGNWFKDGLDDSVGKLNEETQITCMPDCITCEDGFSKCQENTNDKFDYRGNIPLSILDNQLLDLGDVHSEVNKLKSEHFGTRTLSIIIKGGMYYPETYGNTNKNQVNNSSLSLKNGTRVTWINLDQNTRHSITVINDITDRKLFEKMIPFAGTAEYTFSTAGDYLFFDKEHPYLNGRIKVNDNSDATRNVKM